MDTDRFLRISDIFHEAQDLTREARSELLNDVCGDDLELRREVEKLFAEQDDPSLPDMEQQKLFENDPFSKAVTAEFVAGQTLGPYRVVRRLGEGGMGRVYLAERSADFEQQVAIKVARPGHLDAAGVTRFRSEMKFMADLSRHPQIAGILDAGTTDDGRPYLVMEFVDGDQVDNYCDTQRLSLKDRLRLFQSICSAVEIAHQHAVIHRDLKPSNILVTRDGKVKLIDFGIAKILSQSETRETQADVAATQTGFRALTPHYASPEQIRGEVLTTRSDVYSMGVVLYELLTGKRPHDLNTTSVVEIERIVCDEEPKQPSSLAKELATDSLRDRQISSEQLRRSLSGDLDNIVLKCLRKDSNQRYQSVRELSQDIESHLAGFPISARPITTFHRMRLWCERNPLVTALSLALVCSMVAGLMAVGVQWQRAERNASIARAEAIRANKAAKLAEEAAFRERRAAEAERAERIKATKAETMAATAASEAKQQAESAEQVTDFLIGVFQGADQLGIRGYRFGPSPDGSTNPTARELLDRGLKMIETELKDKPQIRATIKTALSETYISLGDLEVAEKLAQSALAIQRKRHASTANAKTADALSVLAMIRYIQGNYEAAVPLYRESVAMLDNLYGEMDPRGASSKLFFAFIVLESNLTGAENHEAEQLINHVLEIRKSQVDPPLHELAHAWLGKAVICRVRKKPIEALHAINEARKALQKDPAGATYVEMAVKAVNVMINWQLGRTEVAVDQTNAVIEDSKRLLGRHHPLATHLQLEMATWMFDTDPERGLLLMEEAVSACRVAYGREPRTARSLYRYAGQLFDAGRVEDAEEAVRESVEIYLDTLGDKNVRTHRALRRHAQVLDKLGQSEEAARQRKRIAQ